MLIALHLALGILAGDPTCPASHVGGCQSSEISEPMEYCSVALRVSSTEPDPAPLVRREHDLASAATHSGEEWFELACVRTALAQWSRTHTGTLNSAVIRPWHERGIIAALAAARAAPTDSALLLLASLVLRAAPGRPDPAHVGLTFYHTLPFAPSVKATARYARGALEILQQRAGRGSADPLVLRACTALALDVGEFGVAHECATEAVIAGAEQSWNVVRLAWLAAHRADSAGTLALLVRAAAAAKSVPDRLDLAWHFKATFDRMNLDFWGLISGANMARARLRNSDDTLPWTIVPASEFMGWVDANSRELPAGGWRSLSDPAVAVAHFDAAAFAGEVFRDCLPRDDARMCTGRKDTRTVRADRLRFWESASRPVAVFPFTTAKHAPRDSVQVVVRQSEFGQRGTTDTVAVRFTGDSAIAAVPRNVNWDSWTVDIDPAHPAHEIDFQDLQAPEGSGPVRISDLALGVTNGVLAWTYHGRRIPISSSHIFKRSAPVQLFYQVLCDSDCGEIRRSVRVVPTGSSAGHRKSLTITADDALRSGVNDLLQEIDVGQLESGSYRLEVGVMLPSGRVITRKTLIVVK